MHFQAVEFLLYYGIALNSKQIVMEFPQYTYIRKKKIDEIFMYKVKQSIQRE